MDLIIFVQ